MRNTTFRLGSHCPRINIYSQDVSGPFTQCCLISRKCGRPTVRKHLRKQVFCHQEVRVSLGDRFTQSTHNTQFQLAIQKVTQAKKRAGWTVFNTMMAWNGRKSKSIWSNSPHPIFIDGKGLFCFAFFSILSSQISESIYGFTVLKIGIWMCIYWTK